MCWQNQITERAYLIQFLTWEKKLKNNVENIDQQWIYSKELPLSWPIKWDSHLQGIEIGGTAMLQKLQLCLNKYTTWSAMVWGDASRKFKNGCQYGCHLLEAFQVLVEIPAKEIERHLWGFVLVSWGDKWEFSSNIKLPNFIRRQGFGRA
jgi:hypothetical protein